MTFGFGFLTIGSLLVYSGYQNRTIGEVLSGLTTYRPGGPGSNFVALLSSTASGTSDAFTGKESVPTGQIGNPTKQENQLKQSHPELHPGVIVAVAILMARFPGLSITSTTGGEHAEDSLHYEGRAVDLGGSTQEMEKAAKFAAKYMTKSLTEGIHNPSLSVKDGKKVPSSFWGEPTWSEHLNHIHIGV